MSEARTLRLEEDVGAIKAAIGRLEPLIVAINATLPHLATKEELADLRGEVRAAWRAGTVKFPMCLEELRSGQIALD